LEQLVGIVSNLKDIDISDLTFEINCAIPGGYPYSFTLDLPLAISMLSSYFQRAIPFGSLFIGEVDLFSKIRPVSAGMVRDVGKLLTEGQLGSNVERVYASDETRAHLQAAVEEIGRPIEVVGVPDLSSLVSYIWPDIVEE
jgi:predicted ATP-dependent serine protease